VSVADQNDPVKPLDFIARLAALVPKPRVNLSRFYGVFVRGGAPRGGAPRGGLPRGGPPRGGPPRGGPPLT
jgi:hypothetical protein